MLKYLLKKEEMNLPDRNLVRRILLDTFEEEFIESGSKDFIKHLKYIYDDEECFKGKKKEY